MEAEGRVDDTAQTTVLLVEDEAVVRHIIRRILEGEGYRVVDTPDPREALEIVEAGLLHFDLLLTDIDMPNMNGWELVGRVTTSRPEVKVLYTSGYPREAFEHDWRLDGKAGILAKPFTMAQLSSAVRQALDGPSE